MIQGEEGTLDFLLIMITDIRHDIKQLQESVFKTTKPREFRTSATFSTDTTLEDHIKTDIDVLTTSLNGESYMSVTEDTTK